MNKSRASQRVRVIRLDEWPAREAVVETRAGSGGPPPEIAPARPWPRPIGSAEAAQAVLVDIDLAPAEPAETERVESVPPLVDMPQQAPVARGRVPEASSEPAVPHLPRGQIRAWQVRVWGEPRAFARYVWGQVLLVLLTAGLYTPWAVAHVRRQQWRHTRLLGRSLDDHESPWALARHWALSLALVAGVWLSWRSSMWLGLVAASLAVLVWPQLVFMRLRQRVTHMSWARRRMDFGGRCSQVYRAVWPMLFGALGLMWATALAWTLSREAGWCAWGLGLSCWLMALPLATWTWFEWRQGQLRLGPWALWWAAKPASVTNLIWRTVIWFLLTLSLTLGLLAVGWAALRMAHVRPGPLGHAILLGAPTVLLAVAVRAYAQARLQNLVWGKTGNRHVRFRSRLNVARYVRQQCRHAMLILLTGGVYWPWAAAATHRMRMQAITVWSRVDADELKARWPVGLAVK